MNSKKTERKPLMTFINRGGKGVPGVAVGDEDPDYSPMDGRTLRPGPAKPDPKETLDRTKPSDKPSGTGATLGKKNPYIRSSRI